MTVTHSHVVPEGSLPVSAMKEDLSLAYLNMIASACGLTVGDWAQDYDGRDTTLSSSVDFYPDMYGPKVDVQLKCTGQSSVQRDDSIAWPLKSHVYDMLSRRNRSTPALLCVLVVPEEVGHWLITDQLGLLARCHMFWQWGHLFAPVRPGQDSQTVHLPRENLLTPQVMLELMEEASRWQPELTTSTR